MPCSHPKPQVWIEPNCFQLGLSCAGINSRRLACGANESTPRAGGGEICAIVRFRSDYGRKDSMKRSILTFIVGLVVWVLVASLLNRVLRLALEGYAAAEPQMVFTHGMMAARLALGALASLAAGAATRAVAPSSARVLWVLGGVLLAAFVPVH